MAKHQKSYTQEFKEQIVEGYNSGTTSYMKLESEYGVNKSTIYTWVKQLSLMKISEKETISAKEYKTLQKKIRNLEIENEILKKLPPYSPTNHIRNSNIYKKSPTHL